MIEQLKQEYSNSIFWEYIYLREGNKEQEAYYEGRRCLAMQLLVDAGTPEEEMYDIMDSAVSRAHAQARGEQS